MIPDFPEEKEKIMKLFNNYLNNKVNALSGILQEVPRRTIHEGHQWTLNRSDGSEETNPYTEIKSSFMLELDEVPTLTIDKIMQKLDGFAQDMANGMSKHFYETINKSIPISNIIEGKSDDVFSKEMVLEMYEKIDIDFDENGNPIPPSIVLPPTLWDQKKDEIQSWEFDKSFQEKRNEIIVKKKEQWLERENNRKLVD